MKLVRYGAPGREKPGIIDADGKIRDLSRVVKDIDGAMLAAGGLAKIRKANLKRLKTVAGKPRLGPCIGQVKGSTKLDYECELAVVIGKRARYLSKDKAMDAVAGYCLANDVSERAFQMEHGQTICKGKGAETFGPLGPWFVSKDEIKNPQNLTMWTNVNGEKRQHGSTKTMVFDVAHLVWYCSQIFVLEPGDVIATGTPPGVAFGMKPVPVYLKAGDVVELGIDGLGTQKQKIVPFKA